MRKEVGGSTPRRRPGVPNAHACAVGWRCAPRGPGLGVIGDLGASEPPCVVITQPSIGGLFILRYTGPDQPAPTAK